MEQKQVLVLQNRVIRTAGVKDSQPQMKGPQITGLFFFLLCFSFHSQKGSVCRWVLMLIATGRFYFERDIKDIKYVQVFPAGESNSL